MDEWKFKLERVDEYLTQPKYHPYVVIKLPKVAHLLPALTVIPGIKVLWCLRDPRDVVTSMLKLKQNMKVGLQEKVMWSVNHWEAAIQALRKFKPLPVAVSWVNDSARKEIQNAVNTLKQRGLLTEAFTPYLTRYKEIKKKHPHRQTHLEQVFLGALCWRLKQEILNTSPQHENVHIVQYEKLIQNPEQETRSLLQFLNVPWHENVLKHHTLHHGTSVGQTDNTRPIDSQNLEKWKGFLAEEDINTIEKICAPVAKEFYSFNSLSSL